MRIGRGDFFQKKVINNPKKADGAAICGVAALVLFGHVRKYAPSPPAGCALHLAAPTAFFPLIESTRPYHPKEVRKGHPYLRFLSLTPLRFVEDRATRQSFR